MCRRNQLIGIALAGIGVGLLLGCHVESVFWCSIFGIAAVVVGLFLLQRSKV